jgi:hypothetical protein
MRTHALGAFACIQAHAGVCRLSALKGMRRRPSPVTVCCVCTCTCICLCMCTCMYMYVSLSVYVYVRMFAFCVVWGFLGGGGGRFVGTFHPPQTVLLAQTVRIACAARSCDNSQQVRSAVLAVMGTVNFTGITGRCFCGAACAVRAGAMRLFAHVGTASCSSDLPVFPPSPAPVALAPRSCPGDFNASVAYRTLALVNVRRTSSGNIRYELQFLQKPNVGVLPLCALVCVARTLTSTLHVPCPVPPALVLAALWRLARGQVPPVPRPPCPTPPLFGPAT